MTIPKTVKIGGLTYRITVEDQLDDTDVAAFVDVQRLLIKIGKVASPEVMQLNFLHEMFHAINNQMTEEFVEFMAMAMNQILVDNPNLFSDKESEVSSNNGKRRTKISSRRQS